MKKFEPAIEAYITQLNLSKVKAEIVRSLCSLTYQQGLIDGYSQLAKTALKAIKEEK